MFHKRRDFELGQVFLLFSFYYPIVVKMFYIISDFCFNCKSIPQI